MSQKNWYKELMQAIGIMKEGMLGQANLCAVVAAMKQDNLDDVLAGANYSLLLAADEGFRYLNGKKPDFVVGDFDSLGYVPKEEETICHPVRKDDTDMMLAVKIGFQKGKKNFLLLGGLGGRLDHTIANLNTLSYILSHGGRGILIGEKESVFLLSKECVTLPALKDETISIFSYGQKAEGVSILGLSYEAKDATLTNDFPLGVSNEFIGQKATIEVKEGTLLVIIQNPNA